MPTHSPASPDVNALIADVIAEHHPELAEVEVRINALFAYPSKAGLPAVKHHGRPAHAVVKVNGEKQRVEGLADATITIDGLKWKDEYTDDQKRALIDHELEHLKVVTDKEGAPKSDDAGRPKLRCREHDFEWGGFDVIARRHGKASFEVQAVRSLVDTRGQLFWAWGDDQAPAGRAPGDGGPSGDYSPGDGGSTFSGMVAGRVG